MPPKKKRIRKKPVSIPYTDVVQEQCFPNNKKCAVSKKGCTDTQMWNSYRSYNTLYRAAHGKPKQTVFETQRAYESVKERLPTPRLRQLYSCKAARVSGKNVLRDFDSNDGIKVSTVSALVQKCGKGENLRWLLCRETIKKKMYGHVDDFDSFPTTHQKWAAIGRAVLHVFVSGKKLKQLFRQVKVRLNRRSQLEPTPFNCTGTVVVFHLKTIQQSFESRGLDYQRTIFQRNFLQSEEPPDAMDLVIGIWAVVISILIVNNANRGTDRATIRESVAAVLKCHFGLLLKLHTL